MHNSTREFINQTQNTQPEMSIDQSTESYETLLNDFGNSLSDTVVFEVDPPKNSELIDKLLSNRGHLGVDEQSGQERYYGSTT